MSGSGLVNEAAPLVHEYATRKRLATLGFTTSLDKLTAFKAECFILIDQTIDEVHAKKANKRGGNS